MKNIRLNSLWKLVVLCNLMVLPTLAQPGGPPPPMSPEKKEEMEAMKVAFLTRKLELSSDEAKTFWPVYNKYQDELDALRENQRKMRKSSRDEMETMSDKDLEKLVDSEIVFRQSELDILKKYNSQFKSVLPMKKVARLYRAEEDFKRELLHRIQERGKGGGNPEHPRDDRKQ